MDRKISLLEELLRREQDLSRSVNQSPEEIQSILDMCSDVIERIDVVDFDIAAARDRLCHVTGIPPEKIETSVKRNDPSRFREWDRIAARIRVLSGEILATRESTIRSMEENNTRTAKDADELSRIRSLLGRYGL